eukprot:scaffold19079_cov56-Phaeocystis_antarctica.AAC.1
MARREIALKPFTLSSEKMGHVGFCCSAARAMPTAISAPPATPHTPAGAACCTWPAPRAAAPPRRRPPPSPPPPTYPRRPPPASPPSAVPPPPAAASPDPARTP